MGARARRVAGRRVVDAEVGECEALALAHLGGDAFACVAFAELGLARQQASHLFALVAAHHDKLVAEQRQSATHLEQQRHVQNDVAVAGEQVAHDLGEHLPGDEAVQTLVERSPLPRIVEHDGAEALAVDGRVLVEYGAAEDADHSTPAFCVRLDNCVNKESVLEE